jgi:hypothetical protein
MLNEKLLKQVVVQCQLVFKWEKMLKKNYQKIPK